MQPEFKSSTALTWSPQQQAFLDWCQDGTGSCVLEACAGTGKTTVLIAGGSKMHGGVLYLAYNKDIATETQEKLAEKGIDWKVMRASTVHAAGFGIIRKAMPGVRVDEHKTRDLFDAFAPEALKPRMGEVLKLVSLAKQSSFGCAGPSIDDDHAWLEMAAHYDVFDDDSFNGDQLELIQLARRILNENNLHLDVVDYDDQVYLPVYHRLPCWRHAVVMVDEAQDTNAARRALVRALVLKGGRVVAVGDPCQAIYGFTGADSDALDLIAQDFNATRLPLTVTYRCPKAVVKFAQQWVSHIEAHETAPEGSVSQTTLEAFMQRNDLDGRSAVLCRNNKPLVGLALALLRRRIPCKLAGKSDIGESLKKLLGRWKVTSLDALETKLDDYLAKQTTKLLAKKQESKVALIEDKVETCKAIISAVREQKQFTVQAAIDWVDSMFTDATKSNLLILSSIHKSKGREWQQVFWLDRAGTCPSKWARQAWQQEQERNLMYVAATRAKESLIEIVVPKQPKEGRGS